MADTYIEKIQLPDGSIVSIKGVPSGGTQGQVLAKKSNADLDLSWTTLQEPDLSGYATKAEVTQISQLIPDVSGLATSTELTSGLALKADSSNTYTKEQVDAKVASVYRYKGTVASESELPKDSNITGDVYNVEDTGANYAWTGTAWDKLSETIDLTPYALKDSVYTKQQVNDIVAAGTVDLSAYYNRTEVNGLLINKADISSVPTKVSQLTNDAGYLTEHQDLSSLATKQELTNGLASKQPTGDYALKSEIPINVSQLNNDANYLTSVPSEYVTESELNSKGYLTSHQDISGKADKATTLSGYGITDAYTKAEIDSMLGNIDTVLDEILGA